MPRPVATARFTASDPDMSVTCRGETPSLAHKLAWIVCHMFTHRQSYNPLTPEAYNAPLRQREMKSLQRRATKLGLTLQPQPAG